MVPQVSIVVNMPHTHTSLIPTIFTQLSGESTLITGSENERSGF